MKYYERKVDKELIQWMNSPRRKPLLIRGARQVGKSSAVDHLGEQFKYYVKINLEKQPGLKALFPENIDVKKTCSNLSATLGTPIVPGETLLFIDEIQDCTNAIMSLRYFKEDYPELHVIAAGSLLEFALDELPSFAVGRIRSLYMYPFSFDEFLSAQGLQIQVDFKRDATSDKPLPEVLHKQMIDQLKSFILVGGMPEAVAEWIETHDYISCAHIHRDILDTYEDDFSKYKKRVSPDLLRQVLRSVALQAGTKFVCSRVAEGVRSANVKDALRLLTLAGLIKPTKHTDANGIPLGAEEDEKYIKYLFFDIGLMLTMLGTPAGEILLANEIDLVNKGPVAEVLAGLEIVKYMDCFNKADVFYWQHMSRNGNAEVDYLTVKDSQILPVEIKSGVQGGMQSLYLFMREKKLVKAVRSSLENFGQFIYVDSIAGGASRHVEIIPLYALSSLHKG